MLSGTGRSSGEPQMPAEQVGAGSGVTMRQTGTGGRIEKRNLKEDISQKQY